MEKHLQLVGVYGSKVLHFWFTLIEVIYFLVLIL